MVNNNIFNIKRVKYWDRNEMGFMDLCVVVYLNRFFRLII